MDVLLFLFLLLLLFCFVFFSLDSEKMPNDKLRCRFEDSINITDGEKQSDGSMLFENVTFSRRNYATINYDISISGTKQVTIPYLRGCPKPSIRLCCPYGEVCNTCKPPNARITCTKDKKAGHMETHIFDEKNNTSSVKLHEQFSFTEFHNTTKNFYYTSNITVIKDGRVLREHVKYLDDDEYCLFRMKNSTKIHAHIFYESKKAEMKDTLYAIVMTISALFIAATFCVYLFVPELRNLHGKCLLCYLFGLIIGYSLLAYLKFNGTKYVPQPYCTIIGLTTYFFFLSAFLWSNVMSFDLYQNLRSTSKFQARFIYYMIYAWGLPLLITLLTVLLDNVKPWRDEYLPGIGTKTCFLKNAKNGKLSPFLYFYMLICIIFTVNIVLFIMTALKIREARRDISKLTSRVESAQHQSNLNNERDKWILFMRLFNIMGITWIMEGVTFFIDSENKNRYVFVYFADIWNLSQGLVVFVLFILKRRVLNLIKKRYNVLRARNGNRSITLTTRTNVDSLVSNSSTSSGKIKRNFVK